MSHARKCNYICQFLTYQLRAIRKYLRSRPLSKIVFAINRCRQKSPRTNGYSLLSMVREFPNLHRFCSSFYTEFMFDFMITILQALFPRDQGLATRIQKLQNRAARIITFQGYDVRSASNTKTTKLGRACLKASKKLKSINV